MLTQSELVANISVVVISHAVCLKRITAVWTDIQKHACLYDITYQPSVFDYNLQNAKTMSTNSIKEGEI